MKSLPKIFLFHQRIDCVELEDLLADIASTIQKKKKSLYFALNIHIFLQLADNHVAKKQYEQARGIYADGVPLVWFSKFLKTSLPGRVSGTDLVERLLENTENKIFIIGGTPSVLKRVHKMYARSVVGSYSPPFGDAWDQKVNQKILLQIKKTKPEIILVAVGALKQEKWLWRYFDETSACVGLGVGSALEILAGEKPRAPGWMQRVGLEWLWRIILEPRRLWKRYFLDAFRFIYFIWNFFLRQVRKQ